LPDLAAMLNPTVVDAAMLRRGRIEQTGARARAGLLDSAFDPGLA
jgi:hypothetical protein